MGNVDPTKPRPFIPLTPAQPEPSKPASNASAKTPAMDPEFVPSGPKPNYGTLFGPGVSGAVFGNASPKIAGMSDGQLVAKTRELVTAMRAAPGKITEADKKLLATMTKALLARMNAKLAPSSPPEAMSSKQLAATLMGYDIAKASGMPLTAQQEAWYAKADKVWKERTTVDPNKELKELDGLRTEAARDMKYKCATAATSAAALVDHSGFVGSLATGLAIVNAFEHGDYLGAAKEVAVARASMLPFGRVLEAVVVADNVAQCVEAKEKLESIESRIEVQQAKKAKP
jgi:hypothetical protein